ncbi:MAG: hypothetical protein BJ554DRAFT_3355 [Olpidium bornovanus]|uniref:Uncharacterized protein n=1 Tax=Olpidium bornovanus TaxID=278681 RepID=A0A8H7ZPN2_9FUNG|nr:MAG: hypothetical protein BJ554DRAFT_3355 [Olpidium bornovanus]
MSSSSTASFSSVRSDVLDKKARAAAAVAAKNDVIRPEDARTPEDFVQVAIQFHEQNRLKESLQYFRRAADADSPIGMLLSWGNTTANADYCLSLRQGCEPNQQLAFQYLQKSAESAVSDLNNLSTVNSSVARHELVMAIYEVTAAYYFEIAANLGDPDAQNDLAWCYE